jgi:pimeloyl-ACP methyl ester carboxylesterase
MSLVALMAAGGANARGDDPAPFGYGCTSQDGVRFCPNPDPAHRVPSFDGIPLDVDVTLPASGNGPFPTIVMLHGYGGDKSSFEATSPGGPAPDAAGGGSEIYHYNTNFFARHGYAVVTPTARGFGGSCGGGPGGDHTGPCGQGFIRLDDTRYEAHDVQYLLGLLADQGIAKPRAIGVTGISYGGGMSMDLAFLRNKVRKTNGKLVPWRSPDGLHMAIRAAFPRWPWSDLVDALIPNGRYLDTQVAPEEQSSKPFGVPIQSYIAGLYALGNISGYYCGGAPASTPCPDPEADITLNNAYLQAGQPVSGAAMTALESVYRNSSPYALSFQGRTHPAPLLIQSGWTDDLFPPSQALRVYNFLKAGKATPVSLQFGDIGHSRGSNKPVVNHAFNDQAAAFFGSWLKHKGKPPKTGSVTAYTQTCPVDAPDGGPFVARSWHAIHPDKFTLGAKPAQTILSTGGDPSVASGFDPIAGTSDSCKSIATTAESGVATYEKPVTKSFTMLGLPKIHATVATTGQFGQIAARLWDLGPDDTQRLISRGVYALKTNQTGKIVFQLHGNGYRFPKGHTVQLELLGRDSPYYQAGNFPFTVNVSKLKASLPTTG